MFWHGRAMLATNVAMNIIDVAVIVKRIMHETKISGQTGTRWYNWYTLVQVVHTGTLVQVVHAGTLVQAGTRLCL
jgi:hypothetical protein